MKKPEGNIFRRAPLQQLGPQQRATPTGPVTTVWMQDSRYSLLLASMIWILLLYMTIPPDVFSAVKVDATQMAKANPLTRALKLGLIASGMVFLLWRQSLAKQLLKSINPLFLTYLALMLVSTAWSLSPGTTINRMISVTAVIATALAFCLASWHRYRLQNVLRPFFTLFVLACILFGLVHPELAIDTFNNGAWQGLTTQKNQFGQLASFGIIFWIHGWLTKKDSIWRVLPGMAICMTGLMLSKSSTSLLGTIFSVWLMLLLTINWTNIRRYMPYMVTTFASLCVCFSLAVLRLIPGSELVLAPIAAISGKDLTFSNRTQIWEIVTENVVRHPILGSGYGGYWIGALPSSPSYEFVTRAGYYPTESHNGYLESVNDLGTVGLLFLFGYLFIYVRQSLQLFKLDRPQAILFIGIFFQQAMINLSEATWMQIVSTSFIVMTIVTVALGRTLLEAKWNASYARHA
jgi:exopolysaccharide production protein ExoQ